jgi:hypothetical protein
MQRAGHFLARAAGSSAAGPSNAPPRGVRLADRTVTHITFPGALMRRPSRATPRAACAACGPSTRLRQRATPREEAPDAQRRARELSACAADCSGAPWEIKADLPKVNVAGVWKERSRHEGANAYHPSAVIDLERRFGGERDGELPEPGEAWFVAKLSAAPLPALRAKVLEVRRAWLPLPTR